MSTSKVFYAPINDKSAIFQSVRFYYDHIIFPGRLKKNTKNAHALGLLTFESKRLKS